MGVRKLDQVKIAKYRFTLFYLHLITNSFKYPQYIHITMANQAYKFDFAPGEDHIALRHQNRCYYVPELFHKSPVFGKLCPLFIRDVLKSKSILLIYGVLGIRHHTSGVIMINNHPIKTIELVGRIISINYREFDSKYGPNVAKFYILMIDDCSDTKRLMMAVKINDLDFENAGLTMDSCHEDIIKVTGTVTQGVDRDLELRCLEVSKIGTKHDLDVEVREWTTRLEFRSRYLQAPWVYEPPVSTANYNYVAPPSFQVSIPVNQHRRNRNRANLTISESQPLPTLDREDSIVLARERGRMEIIDLSEEEEEEEDDDDCVIIEPIVVLETALASYLFSQPCTTESNHPLDFYLTNETTLASQ